MLFALDLLFLAGTLVSDIKLYSDAIYEAPPGRDQIVAISMHREFWRDDGEGKCAYTGVMVPFTHDWVETEEGAFGTRVVAEADPDKVVGQAILINRKVCVGRAPETILRAGQTRLRSNAIITSMGVLAHDVASMNPDVRFKWLPQVFDRINALAAQENATAERFLASMAELAATRSELAAAASGSASVASPAASKSGRSATDTDRLVPNLQ